MPTYDVVLIGGGHNGLVAAAYLLKAGLTVCVLERYAKAGGGCLTEEVTLPGFKHDLHSVVHSVVLANPMLAKDELSLLSRYGLEYVIPEVQLASPFQDGTSIMIYRDLDRACQSIAKVSAHDADSYYHFVKWGQQIRALLQAHQQTEAHPQESPLGREVLSLTTASTLDILDRWFEHDGLKAMIAKYNANRLLAPDEPGTGLVNVMRHVGNHVTGSGYPKGGSGALTDKLAECVWDLGGTILTGAEVEHLEVHAGRAEAAIVKGGERFAARRALVSSIHILQLFRDLIGPDHLDPALISAVEEAHPPSFSAIVINLALKEAPQYDVAEDIGASARVEIPGSCSRLMRYVADVRQGRLPAEKCPYVICQTRHDPSRAPAGRHTLYLYDLAPYDPIPDGPSGWERVKEQVMEEVIDEFRRYTKNMDDGNILARHCESPVDRERRNASFLNGAWTHAALTADLFRAKVAYPGATSYRGPFDHLYLCGSSTHPGSGVTGISGRSVAGVILQDLGRSLAQVVGN